MTSRKSYIVGAAESRLGIVPDATVLELQSESILAALENAGLTLADVDGVMTAGTWDRQPAVMLSEYLGINPRVTNSTHIGGASFENHVGAAADAIAARRAEVVVISYGSTQRSRRERSLAGRGAHLTSQFENSWGLPLPLGAYALAADRYFSRYGFDEESLASVAVAARDWARLTENAFRREPLTLEEALSSPMVSTPLRRSDCCLVTDGGGAIIVTSEAVARQTRLRPIELLGVAEAYTHYHIQNMPDLTETGARISGPRALAQAGCSLDDIDVVELYDSFTITVLLTLEALGFCAPGEAREFVKNGRISPGGSFPMNTQGGGLSYCHPGMFGIFCLIEAVRQLRGECGPRQVENAEVALVHATGGVMGSSVTCVLGKG